MQPESWAQSWVQLRRTFKLPLTNVKPASNSIPISPYEPSCYKVGLQNLPLLRYCCIYRDRFRPHTSTSALEMDTRRTYASRDLYAAVFCLISVLDGVILGLRREICYVPVKSYGLSEPMVKIWAELMIDDEHSRMWPPDTVEEAFDDLKTGAVRRKADVMFIPVLAIQTLPEDWHTSWDFLLIDVRKLLITQPFFIFDQSRLNWGVCYGVAAYVQGRLQDEVAEQYVKDAMVQDVVWFRKLKDRDYSGEVERLSFRLG